MEAFSRKMPYADQITMIPFSSETGEGAEELRAILEDVVLEDPEQTSPVMGEDGSTLA